MHTGEGPVSHGLAEQVLALDPKNEERSRLDGVSAPHLGEIVRESHFTIARVNGHGISSDASPPAVEAYVRKAVVDVGARKWLDDREAVGVGNVVAAKPGLVVGLHDGKLVDGGWGNVGGKPQHRVDSRLIQILSCGRRRIGPPGQRRQTLDRRFVHDPAH